MKRKNIKTKGSYLHCINDIIECILRKIAYETDNNDIIEGGQHE